MKKINQYKRTYYKEQGALLGVIIVFIIFILPVWYQSSHEEYVKDPVVAVATTTPPTIEEKIQQYFPKNYKTMIAIAHAESHMKMTAKGYNCFMNGSSTIVYTERVAGSHSDVCPVQWRKYAWSVDCFLLQKNYKGKECPSGVTLDQHLQEVADLSRVQGLTAWSSFNDGKHLQYLVKN